ncbi:MAG: hypothetical protein JWQ98_330 [Chlorobi bacterium]|jgi:hypothetical protein|nr:hypothetical protein [Chlorobiota bacterium]
MKIKSFALALAAVAGLALSGNIASAQEGCPGIVLPNGTVLTCILGPGGTKVYIDAFGNTFPATTAGSGTFTVIASGTAPCNATLTPAAINIQSNAGPFGNVVTTLDPTRPSPVSSISSQTVASAFPATEDFFFYANATVSSLPGQYRSIQPFHFSSRNVRSFNPHRNERFAQVDKVDFEDINRPGIVVFSVQGTSITLN